MLKVYDKEDLKQLLEELTYEYLATDNKTYFLEREEDNSTSVPSCLLNKRLATIKEIEGKIKEYSERRENISLQKDREVYTECIRVIQNEKDIQENSCLQAQKELWAKEHNIFNSRTIIEFPLKGKINKLYDDFNLIVLMFDDLCTVKGNKVEQFEALSTVEEKIQFVKDNIEITHISLGKKDNVSISIIVHGDVNTTYLYKEILPSEYLAFNSISEDMFKRIESERMSSFIRHLQSLLEHNHSSDYSVISKLKRQRVY